MKTTETVSSTKQFRYYAGMAQRELEGINTNFNL